MIRWLFLAAVWAVPAMAEDAAVSLSPKWEYVADGVMGGVSQGQIGQIEEGGRAGMRLTGEVSTANNGGFIQMAFDLRRDVSGFQGLAFDVKGNGETYEIRLRTEQLSRPWQSFRYAFQAPQAWRTIHVPFAALEAHRTDATFDPAQLRRVGILAIGREFAADVAISEVRLYR